MAMIIRTDKAKNRKGKTKDNNIWTNNGKYASLMSDKRKEDIFGNDFMKYSWKTNPSNAEWNRLRYSDIFFFSENTAEISNKTEGLAFDTPRTAFFPSLSRR